MAGAGLPTNVSHPFVLSIDALSLFTLQAEQWPQ